jgi:hypothetical protein
MNLRSNTIIPQEDLLEKDVVIEDGKKAVVNIPTTGPTTRRWFPEIASIFMRWYRYNYKTDWDTITKKTEYTQLVEDTLSLDRRELSETLLGYNDYKFPFLVIQETKKSYKVVPDKVFTKNFSYEDDANIVNENIFNYLLNIDTTLNLDEYTNTIQTYMETRIYDILKGSQAYTTLKNAWYETIVNCVTIKYIALKNKQILEKRRIQVLREITLQLYKCYNRTGITRKVLRPYIEPIATTGYSVVSNAATTAYDTAASTYDAAKTRTGTTGNFGKDISQTLKGVAKYIGIGKSMKNTGGFGKNHRNIGRSTKKLKYKGSGIIFNNEQYVRNTEAEMFVLYSMYKYNYLSFYDLKVSGNNIEKLTKQDKENWNALIVNLAAVMVILGVGTSIAATAGAIGVIPLVAGFFTSMGTVTNSLFFTQYRQRIIENINAGWSTKDILIKMIDDKNIITDEKDKDAPIICKGFRGKFLKRKYEYVSKMITDYNKDVRNRYERYCIVFDSVIDNLINTMTENGFEILQTKALEYNPDVMLDFDFLDNFKNQPNIRIKDENISYSIKLEPRIEVNSRVQYKDKEGIVLRDYGDNTFDIYLEKIKEQQKVNEKDITLLSNDEQVNNNNVEEEDHL